MILSHSQSPTGCPSQNKSCLSAETGAGTAGKKIERKGGSVLKCTVDIYCMWKTGGERNDASQLLCSKIGTVLLAQF